MTYERLSSLVQPAGVKADCVSCGASGAGRYAGLPVCFECYASERLLKWLTDNGNKSWPDRSPDAHESPAEYTDADMAIAERAWPRLYPDRRPWDDLGSEAHEAWAKFVNIVRDEVTRIEAGASTYRYDSSGDIVIVTRLDDSGTVERYLVTEAQAEQVRSQVVLIETTGPKASPAGYFPPTDTSLDDLPQTELALLRRLRPVR